MNWIIIDFGTFEMKALNVRIDAHKVQVVDFLTIPSRPDYFKGLGFPETPAWAAMTIALNEKEWLNNEEEVMVVASLPSAYLETRYLKFPFRNEKQIEKVISFEVEGGLPFDLEDVLMRHKLLEGDGIGAKKEGLVIAFCYKRDQIKVFETELKKFQISTPPISVEILSLSALRQAITAEPVFGLLDLGHSKSQFLLLNRQGQILTDRVLMWGGEKIVQKIASDLSLDFTRAEEAFWQFQPTASDAGIVKAIEGSIQSFVMDLRQTLKASQSHGLSLPQPLPIYVFGGIAHSPELLEKIEAGLKNEFQASLRHYPVEALLAKSVTGWESIKEPEKALSALAVALSQLRSHRSKIPVFSESSFQFQQNLKKLKSSSFSLLRKVALLLIAPFAYSILQFVIQERENKVVVAELNRTLDQAGVRTGDSQSTEEILKKLKAERAANRQKLEKLQEDNRSPLVVLTELSKLIPNNTKIDVRDLKITDALVTVSAETSSTEAANQITGALKQKFPNIKMGAVSNCASGQADCKTFTFEFEREQDS